MALKAAFARQLEQQLFDQTVDPVFRQVGKQVRRLLAEGREPIPVGSEGLAQVELRRLPASLLQRRPYRRLVATQPGRHRQAAFINCSSLMVSAANARIPSASFSVAIASSFKA